MKCPTCHRDGYIKTIPALKAEDVGKWCMYCNQPISLWIYRADMDGYICQCGGAFVKAVHAEVEVRP